MTETTKTQRIIQIISLLAIPIVFVIFPLAMLAVQKPNPGSSRARRVPPVTPSVSSPTPRLSPSTSSLSPRTYPYANPRGAVWIDEPDTVPAQVPITNDFQTPAVPEAPIIWYNPSPYVPINHPSGPAHDLPAATPLEPFRFHPDPAVNVSTLPDTFKRAEIDPKRIEASYVEAVSNEYELRKVKEGESFFSLIFKGLNNLSEIPEKHLNNLTLIVTSEEIFDKKNTELLKEQIEKGTVFILQLSSDERNMIIDDFFYLGSYFAELFMIEYKIEYKINYFMLPDDDKKVSNDQIKSQCAGIVVPTATVSHANSIDRLEGAVVVDISDVFLCKTVLKNLDNILFKRTNTKYPLCKFTNRWVSTKNTISSFLGSIPNLIQDNTYVNCSRANVLMDSFNYLKYYNFQNMKYSNLSVTFTNEQGIDVGGLYREWFTLLSKAIFSPETGLFVAAPDNRNTYMPNPLSYKTREHLKLFEFAGMVVARAIIKKSPINVHLTKAMYKYLLEINPELEDLKEIDESKYKSMKDISELTEINVALGWTDFEVATSGSESDYIQLKPDGGNINLNMENKDEYVALYANFRMIYEVENQLIAFKKGFNALIPAANIVKKITVEILDFLIAGEQELDIEDWKANTEYQGYTKDSPLIIWFWDLMKEWNDEERRSMLRFATGLDSVPVEGFAGFRDNYGPKKFSIHKVYPSVGRNGNIQYHLPAAHTCFYYVDIPEYPTKEMLKSKLLKAIEEGNMGFQLA